MFPVALQPIAATPPLFSVKLVDCSPKAGLGRRVSQKKLASEAYRAIGGVARNSIANHAIVGSICLQVLDKQQIMHKSKFATLSGMCRAIVFLAF